MKLKKSNLLPVRHPIGDFFVCDVLDAVPKDDLASMEHPVFSLSTAPDTRVRRYEHNGNFIQIAPSVLGLATIHDKDVLIFCISQIMAKINNGEPPSRTLRLKAYDLLVATNRQTSGRGYELLKDAFERLAGTRLTTDIRTNGERIISGFGLLDSWKIVVKDQKTERMTEVQVTISEWMFNSILGHEVLTINRDYFRLRKPLERRIYEIARKHCGLQKEWRIDIETLRKKSGAASPIRLFRSRLGKIVENNHLPDYALTIQENMVVFRCRSATKAKLKKLDTAPYLQPESYDKARRAAPGLDVYYLESEWRSWWNHKGRPELTSPDAAFIAFCRKRASGSQQATLL